MSVGDNGHDVDVSFDDSHDNFVLLLCFSFLLLLLLGHLCSIKARNVNEIYGNFVDLVRITMRR